MKLGNSAVRLHVPWISICFFFLIAALAVNNQWRGTKGCAENETTWALIFIEYICLAEAQNHNPLVFIESIFLCLATIFIHKFRLWIAALNMNNYIVNIRIKQKKGFDLVLRTERATRKSMCLQTIKPASGWSVIIFLKSHCYLCVVQFLKFVNSIRLNRPWKWS